MMQHVGKQQREGLIADDLARAPHGMTKPQRRLLAREARLARVRQITQQQIELVLLAALFQRPLELELAVEVILDDSLVAAGHEDEVLDAGRARLVHDVLNHGAVDDGQHLLRHGLGGREETRAQPCNGEHGLADGFSGACHAHLRDGCRLIGIRRRMLCVGTFGKPSDGACRLSCLSNSLTMWPDHGLEGRK